MTDDKRAAQAQSHQELHQRAATGLHQAMRLLANGNPQRATGRAIRATTALKRLAKVVGPTGRGSKQWPPMIRHDKDGAPVLWQPTLIYGGFTTKRVTKPLDCKPTYCRNEGMQLGLDALDSGQYPDAVGCTLVQVREVQHVDKS